MELQQLLRQRGEMNKRIEVLRKTIRALLGREVSGETSFPAVRMTPRKREGITELCRTVLKEAKQPLTRMEITEAIRASYPMEAARHRNLPAAVTAVLRYLLESGEANDNFNDEGRRTWFAVRDRIER
jgi:hypothetical protein